MNIVEHKLTEKTAERKARYFHFSQNNSGGSFDISDSVAHHVIIQAYDAKDANRIAENIGIYFNGCETGADCDCCGDRWGEQWVNEEGDETPSIYGNIPETYEDVFTKSGQPVCHVYHIDGSKTTYRKPTQE